MHVLSSAVFAQNLATPSYFSSVVIILLAAGALGWLVATAFGFTRTRAFGASTKWFALSALCLLLFHLHLVVFMLAAFFTTTQPDSSLALGIGAFFNLFIVLGSVCAVMGFVRLTDAR